jgi:hypothetical protein
MKTHRDTKEHALIQTHTHKHTRFCACVTHTCTHMQHTYLHTVAYMHTYTHEHTKEHALIQTYTQTHTHTERRDITS